MRHLLPSLLLVLAACNQNARPLYYDGDPPTISGIGGESSTLGNLGGAEIALQGSGFGDDPTAVVVQFGSQNAEIVAVSDTELTLIVPNGPIEGGAVDVKVATEGGVALAEGLYTYEVGTLYEGEASYVHVNDYYYSCYGGAAADSAGVGCQDIVYLGNTGLTGTAAFYDFIFPRVHTPNIGFYSGTDLSPGVWGVTAPAYTLFTSGVSELRQNVPNFTLVNPVIEGEEWCADLSSLASWTWNGTDTLDPVTLRAGGDLLSEAEDCTVPNTRLYDQGELQFCEVAEYQENHSNDYQADWPVGAPFFVPAGEGGDVSRASRDCRDGRDNNSDGKIDGDDPLCHPTVRFDSKGTGLDGAELVLPEPVTMLLTQGVTPDDEPYQDIWAVLGLETCPGVDGPFDPAAPAIKVEWTPSGVTYSDDPQVLAVDTNVRITLTIVSLGWLGADSTPIRATITVPDAYAVDPETGRSVVEVPAEVLYQLPDVTFDTGGCTQGTFGEEICSFGDPTKVGFGYLVITADRVTEYRLDAGQLYGDLVFSYSSGDFTFVEWDNPFNNASCDNCQDEDGDGWIDDLDPDCAGDGEAEDGSLDGLDGATCSDGLDNDSDGFIDYDDDDCESGLDGETNCGDGADNDGDGWTDQDDGECDDAFGVELGEDDAAWQCTDGLDNDSDGWIDGDDPACATGADPEDDGFTEAVCNDGLDNDGHGDIDAADPYCQRSGAEGDSELPRSYGGDCIDGEDNDEDGYTDAFDPDCEYSQSIKESEPFHDIEDRPATKECYDGADNDADGHIDAADPGCWNVNEALGYVAIPDGFLANEADDGDCVDTLDNDTDGLTDLEDPGCAPGVGKSEAAG